MVCRVCTAARVCDAINSTQNIYVTELRVILSSAFLHLQDGVSRVHSSRRVFDAIKRAGSDVPVLHHIRFAQGTHRWAGT
jgi:hypothetical protein